jgi:hypothetical protein
MWQIEVMWRATPWAPYGLAVAVIGAVALARSLARRGGTSTIGTGLWLLFVGTIVTLTMTPGLSHGVVHHCGLLVSGILTPAELLAFHERGLNAWMYVPPALLAVLARRRETWVTALAITAALPFVSELTQWAIPALGRQCQVQDIVGNLTGVAIGAAAGFVVRGLIRLPRPVRTA